MNKGRKQNRVVETLVEGDIIRIGETFEHVESGEVDVYADGTVDSTNAELVEVSTEAIFEAEATGNRILNLDDI